VPERSRRKQQHPGGQPLDGWPAAVALPVGGTYGQGIGLHRSGRPTSRTSDADAVKDAQALGLKVIPWTVNSPSDLDRLIGWGVDGIITDYPDRGRAAMRQRALALPKALKN
jgi:glycerophosphoryl diester phosphodiesterase